MSVMSVQLQVGGAGGVLRYRLSPLRAGCIIHILHRGPTYLVLL